MLYSGGLNLFGPGISLGAGSQITFVFEQFCKHLWTNRHGMKFSPPFFTQPGVIVIAGFIQEGGLINDDGGVNNQRLKAYFMVRHVFHKLDIILLYLFIEESSVFVIWSKNHYALLIRIRI